MLVSKQMQKDPITIRKDDTLRFAADLLKEKRIRTLPVVDDGKVVGMVTDRDVRQAQASTATSLEVSELYYLLEKVKVNEIMTKNVITISPDATIEEAAKTIHDKRIGGQPVVDDTGELKGIITETDVLEVLLEVMGMGEDSSRIELILDDKPGQLVEAIQVIKNHSVNLISVVTAKGPDPNTRACVLRIKTTELDQIVNELNEKEFTVN
jgi:acetoin utilization protein AcuB